jgi:hypothetical protein
LNTRFGRIAVIEYGLLYGDASLADTYDYIQRVGTVSEAPPYIFQCQQLAHIEDSTELAKRLVDY